MEDLIPCSSSRRSSEGESKSGDGRRSSVLYSTKVAFRSVIEFVYDLKVLMMTRIFIYLKVNISLFEMYWILMV